LKQGKVTPANARFWEMGKERADKLNCKKEEERARRKGEGKGGLQWREESSKKANTQMVERGSVSVEKNLLKKPGGKDLI